MDKERAMGLRWTFMPVYWRVLEPEGPVKLSRETPLEWQALDTFIMAAKERGLNVLMQAPVVGGNGRGPPEWAGRRESGKFRDRYLFSVIRKARVVWAVANTGGAAVEIPVRRPQVQVVSVEGNYRPFAPTLVTFAANSFCTGWRARH